MLDVICDGLIAGAAGCLSGALSGLAPKELQPVAEGFRSWPRQAGWTCLLRKCRGFHIFEAGMAESTS